MPPRVRLPRMDRSQPMKRTGKPKSPAAGTGTLTRKDAESYLRRFPAQGRMTIALNLLMVLGGNAVVLSLLLGGQLRAAHLIALVMVETVLLFAFSWLLQRAVPRKDWPEEPKPWRQNLPVIAFVLVWLGGAYSITLAMIGGVGDFLALMHSPDAWITSRLYLPLAYTMVLAAVHAASDWQYYRRRGGPFFSDVSHDAMARYLTLILGGIPFAMPFFVVVIGGFKGIEFVTSKARVAPQQSLLAGAAMLLVAGAGFGLIQLLIGSGVNGWAIGFVIAKLIAEVLIVCIPLVMSQVARPAAPAGGVVPGA